MWPAISSAGPFSPSDIIKYVWKTIGCIYMIRCGLWDIKYIGQTSTPLHLRINNHRKLCNSEKVCEKEYIQSKFEYDHFRIHSFNKIKIYVLQIVPDLHRRLEYENMYIIKFKTAYPFGLNDRVNNISINSIKNDTCIYKNIFQNFINPRTNRVRSKKRNNKYIDLHEFLGEIDNKGLKEKDLIKYVKSKILGINKRKAKKLLKIALNYKFKYNLIKDLILDLIKYKIGNDKLENIDNFESYLVINFSHKSIDFLNGYISVFIW